MAMLADAVHEISAANAVLGGSLKHEENRRHLVPPFLRFLREIEAPEPLTHGYQALARAAVCDPLRDRAHGARASGKHVLRNPRRVRGAWQQPESDLQQPAARPHAARSQGHAPRANSRGNRELLLPADRRTLQGLYETASQRSASSPRGNEGTPRSCTPRGKDQTCAPERVPDWPDGSANERAAGRGYKARWQARGQMPYHTAF